jgi:outer membrane immunogenic protein
MNRHDMGANMVRNVKLALAGLLMGLGATGVATAADMPLKAKPLAGPGYNWTGCYIGGDAGGAWTRVDTSRASIDTVGAAFANYGREDDKGFMGGGQAGCDFQTTNLVFGIQGTFDFGGVKGSHALTDFPTFSEANNLQAVYTATGRMGYLYTPSFLGYVKVGMAWMQDKNQVLQPGGALLESAKFTLPGMTAGLGFEWMFLPNWSAFAEWNYMWIEDTSGQHFTASPGLFPPGEVLNVKQTVQTVRVGVNYKFHWDGPVVAKY